MAQLSSESIFFIENVQWFAPDITDVSLLMTRVRKLSVYEELKVFPFAVAERIEILMSSNQLALKAHPFDLQIACYLICLADSRHGALAVYMAKLVNYMIGKQSFWANRIGFGIQDGFDSQMFSDFTKPNRLPVEAGRCLQV